MRKKGRRPETFPEGKPATGRRSNVDDTRSRQVLRAAGGPAGAPARLAGQSSRACSFQL